MTTMQSPEQAIIIVAVESGTGKHGTNKEERCGQASSILMT